MGADESHLNDTGRPRLTDDLLLSWNVDPGLKFRNGRLTSEDRIAVPTVASRSSRPDVTTAIPNLFLAGDYLKSDWQTSIMETASYNARRAANAILDRNGSHESPAKAIGPYRPPEWEPLKRIDEDRWRHGQPNLLDADLTLAETKQLLIGIATT